MSATVTNIQTILEKSKPRGPDKCHYLDHRGFAICGAFGPDRDDDGKRIKGPGAHSRKTCRELGHKVCTACKELDRQLDGEGMVA
jgi:hypothetical protein